MLWQTLGLREGVVAGQAVLWQTLDLREGVVTGQAGLGQTPRGAMR